ncbi:MAG: protein kinase [Euryarchaeota archaeon]|nr:protein kinase [Euryarchaeota archaeon]
MSLLDEIPIGRVGEILHRRYVYNESDEAPGTWITATFLSIFVVASASFSIAAAQPETQSAPGFALELSTNWISLEPGGETVRIEATVISADFAGDVSLRAEGASGFTMRIEPPTLTVSRGSRVSANIDVTPGQVLIPGTFPMKAIAASSGVEVNASFEVFVEAPPGSWRMETVTDVVVPAGGRVSMPLTVTSDVAAGYLQLATLNSPWLAVVLSPDQFDVKEGDVNFVTVEYAAARDAPSGVYPVLISGEIGPTASVRVNVTINGGPAVVSPTEAVRKSTSVLPARIAGAAAVWTGTEAILFGGLSEPFRDRIVRYMPEYGASVGDDLDDYPGVAYQSAVWDALSERAYVFGGRNVSGATDVVLTYEASSRGLTLPYNAGDETYYQVASLPSGRYAMAAAFDDLRRDAYLFGGTDGVTATDEVLRFDAATDEVEKMSARLPHPLYNATAIWDGRHVYIFGGTDGATGAARTDILRYDPVSDEIEVVDAVIPSGELRSGAATEEPEADARIAGGPLRMTSFYDGRHAYLLGLGTGADSGKVVYRFDPASSTVEGLTARLSEPATDSAPVWDASRSKAYILGGLSSTQERLRSIVEFEPSLATASTGNLPPAIVGGEGAAGLDLGQFVLPGVALVSAAGIALAVTNPKMRSGLSRLTTRIFAPREKLAARPGGPTRYVIEKQLGQGGAGAAYLARDELLGRRVVIKKIHSKGLAAETREMLLREARSASMVTHQNLVTIHDVTQLDGEDVLVMEHVTGGSLEDALKRGAMQESVALLMAARILRGLAALHRAGIVHRDIKPANILLTSELLPKISDLGIARTPGEAHLSMPGVQPGTLLYMSPEQVRGDEVDARSDLYSAAAVVYEMLTGRYYLGEQEKTDYAMRKAIVERAPALPAPEIPAGLNDVLARGLGKDPAARYQTADELRAGIEGLGDWRPGATTAG